MIDLDGSQGEGGGQILRSCLALSLLTQKAFTLRNIRAKRSRPGLQPQHLTCVRAAATIGQAETKGANKGSTLLSFVPGLVSAGGYTFSIGTAGATSLVLHTVYLPLLLRTTGASQVTITGGTHVDHSPCFHFLDSTWRAYLQLCGARVELDMKQPGFYPRGGGVIQATIHPCAKISGLVIDGFSRPKCAHVLSAVAGLPQGQAESVLARQRRQARHRLKQLGLSIESTEETWEHGTGTMLSVTLDTEPAPTLFFGLGARGKPADRVADDALDQVESFLHAEPLGIDPHSADQLVLPLAFADGPSRFPVCAITTHLLTNIAVINAFVDRKIACEGEEGQPGIVRID